MPPLYCGLGHGFGCMANEEIMFDLGLDVVKLQRTGCNEFSFLDNDSRTLLGGD
jgi:hypothetical protein